MDAIRIFGPDGALERSTLGPNFKESLLAEKASDFPVVLVVNEGDLTELVRLPQLAHLLVERQPRHPRTQLARVLVGQVGIPYIVAPYRYPQKALSGIKKILVIATQKGDRNVMLLGVAAGVFKGLVDLLPGTPVESSVLHLPGQNPKVVRETIASRFVGESELARQVRALVFEAANVFTPVLIVGETGTGKEEIAKLIRELGPRRDRPMVSLSCPAIPGELFAAELFGSVEGAFTNAVDREGAFREAHSGTLFLDELQDLAIQDQPKLLRVIETGMVRPVGSDEEVQVDVRIIAAASRDLEKMVQAGEFRRELLKRLQRFVIRTPALRDDPADVSVLAQHLWSGLDGATGVPLPDEILREFATYPWEGNVRELRNVLEGLLRSCRDGPPTREALMDVVKLLGLDWNGVAVAVPAGGGPVVDPVAERPGVSLRHLDQTEYVLRRLKQELRPVVIDCRTDPETIRNVRAAVEPWLEQLDELSNYPGRFGSMAWRPFIKIKGRLREFILSLDREPRDAPSRWHAELDAELTAVIETLVRQSERVWRRPRPPSPRQLSV